MSAPLFGSFVEAVCRFEDGDLSERDTITLFAELIKTGQAWILQGHYGRRAAAMIEAEMISPDGEILIDLEVVA